MNHEFSHDFCGSVEPRRNGRKDATALFFPRFKEVWERFWTNRYQFYPGAAFQVLRTFLLILAVEQGQDTAEWNAPEVLLIRKLLDTPAYNVGRVDLGKYCEAYVSR